MSDSSKIEWTAGDDGKPGATWNPVTGCTKISAGCDHCYAETFAERWRGIPGHHFENGFDVTLRPERLEQPLRWKRGRRIFVNSMSDLFHEKVPDLFIEQIFDVMEQARQHTFLVLTKRHGRMRSFVRRREQRNEDYAQAFENNPIPARRTCPAAAFARKRADNPPPNIWLGVSAEDQKWFDIRVPALLATPAAVRFVSAEPLLGPVTLDAVLCWSDGSTRCSEPEAGISGLDWLIIGGESGPGARPMQLEWASRLVSDCREREIAPFVKQLGSVVGRRIGAGSKGGDWDAWPTDLRVREFPGAADRSAA